MDRQPGRGGSPSAFQEFLQLAKVGTDGGPQPRGGQPAHQPENPRGLKLDHVSDPRSPGDWFQEVAEAPGQGPEGPLHRQPGLGLELRDLEALLAGRSSWSDDAVSSAASVKSSYSRKNPFFQTHTSMKCGKFRPLRSSVPAVPSC